MNENGAEHGANKASKLKHWADKVRFFEILIAFGKLVFFYVFGCWQKAGQKGNTNQIWCERVGPNGRL